MTTPTQQIVNHAWNFAHALRDDGLSYMGYTEQITFLLFLKMAEELSQPPYSRPRMVPEGYDWPSLLARDGQAALAALNQEGNAANEMGRRSLEQFLSQLPGLWQAGEVRPTHRGQAATRRYWRTRRDPFETVWPEVLAWLQREPDVTAKELLGRLQRMYPGDFPDGQLRTLQRRVRQWRQVMARKLVYACLDGDEDSAVAVVVGDATGSGRKVN